MGVRSSEKIEDEKIRSLEVKKKISTSQPLSFSTSAFKESAIRNPQSAFLSEIFSSIQGEGLLVGLRQIFVRFSGCTLTCDYCDTPESRLQRSEFRVHGVGAHGGAPNIIPNPVSPERLTEIVNSFQTHPNLHHSISLTGGEPLEQVDFLKEWLPEFKGGTAGGWKMEDGGKNLKPQTSNLKPVHQFTDSPKIYLETNGILSSHLSEIIDLVDIIGMDIKLPSVTGVKPVWEQHREFLRIASKKEVFVKVVVARRVAEDDVIKAMDLVASINRGIPFILQPQTPIDLDAVGFLHLQEVVSHRLSHVRVIPQVHKLLNIR